MKKYVTRILTSRDVRRVIDIRKSISAVEKAYRQFEKGCAQMPPKVYLTIDKYAGDFRAMPAYINSQDSCIVKWVNVHPKNTRKSLPTVMGTIILSDVKTGYPLAIMDGTLITALRTGAASAVASKYLANKKATTLALVGCGAQAAWQMACILELFSLEKINVWGHQLKLANNFVRRNKGVGVPMKACRTIKECVKDIDIVCTITPSRKPLIKKGWLKPGVHVNAIGADAKGKQELDINIIKGSKVIIDEWVQASHSGEINVPLSKGQITKKNIYGQLGQIVCGKKKGRGKVTDMTVFDSTGLAIQDAAVANLIYKSALKRNIGKKVSLI